MDLYENLYVRRRVHPQKFSSWDIKETDHLWTQLNYFYHSMHFQKEPSEGGLLIWLYVNVVCCS